MLHSWVRSTRYVWILLLLGSLLASTSCIEVPDHVETTGEVVIEHKFDPLVSMSKGVVEPFATLETQIPSNLLPTDEVQVTVKAGDIYKAKVYYETVVGLGF